MQLSSKYMYTLIDDWWLIDGDDDKKRPPYKRKNISSHGVILLFALPSFNFPRIYSFIAVTLQVYSAKKGLKVKPLCFPFCVFVHMWSRMEGEWIPNPFVCSAEPPFMSWIFYSNTTIMPKSNKLLQNLWQTIIGQLIKISLPQVDYGCSGSRSKNCLKTNQSRSEIVTYG